MANDDNKSPEAHLRMKQRMGERDGTGANRTAITSLSVMAQLVGWATPAATDGSKAPADHHGRNLTLVGQANLAGWQTPKANEKVRPDEFLAGREPNAEEALSFGPGTISSRAGTAKRGVLNPEHSRWLMGFPQAWSMCGLRAMLAKRRRRGSSQAGSDCSAGTETR